MHWDAKNPKEALARYAERRATKYNLEYTITSADFDYPEFCPILGLKLKTGDGPFSDNSATLDRINIDLGYVKGNVWVVSRLANAMKANSRFRHRVLYLNWVVRSILQNPQWLNMIDWDLMKKAHEHLLRINNVSSSNLVEEGACDQVLL